MFRRRAPACCEWQRTVRLTCRKWRLASGSKQPMETAFGGSHCAQTRRSESGFISSISTPGRARYGFTMRQVSRCSARIRGAEEIRMVIFGPRSCSQIPWRSNINPQSAVRLRASHLRISELAHLWQMGRVVAPRNPRAAQLGNEQFSRRSRRLGLDAPIEMAEPEASATAASTNYSCFLDATCYSSPAIRTIIRKSR